MKIRINYNYYNLNVSSITFNYLIAGRGMTAHVWKGRHHIETGSPLPLCGFRSRSQVVWLGVKLLDLMSHCASPMPTDLKRTSGDSFALISNAQNSFVLFSCPCFLNPLACFGEQQSSGLLGLGDKWRAWDEIWEMALGQRLWGPHG